MYVCVYVIDNCMQINRRQLIWAVDKVNPNDTRGFQKTKGPCFDLVRLVYAVLLCTWPRLACERHTFLFIDKYRQRVTCCPTHKGLT